MNVIKTEKYELYQVDCRDILHTLTADVVITDPPYGVNLKKKTYKNGSNGRTMSSLSGGYSTYTDTPEEFLRSILPAVCACIQRFNRAVITPGNRQLFKYPEPSAVGSIFSAAGAGLCSWGFTCSHPILYYGKDPYLQKCMGGRPNSFQGKNSKASTNQHPCAKPDEWMEWLVNRGSLLGETVLDPFMGSGTTGVACAKLGRRFVGIELDPKYFEVATERVEKAYTTSEAFPWL